MADYTPIAEIPKILNELRTTFQSGKTRPLEWRKQQLRQLARFAQENVEPIAECLRLDLGKPRLEVLVGEIAPIVQRCLHVADNLDEWAKPEVAPVHDWQAGWKARTERHPKGVALVISPWNYPMILSMQPVYGAIAAGCCVALKVSEVSSHFASFVAANLTKYLDPSAFRVILGGVPEITKILELKWDHIFYTGNGKVGRIIAAAAAKHLTPITLELGGKSPAIVDATADIPVTARRILFGKCTNAGQICVAPDYILAEESIVKPLVEALKQRLTEMFPEGALASASISRIVSDAHFARLKALLSSTKGKIVAGGNWDTEPGKRGFEPTVVVDVKDGDSLLSEELFGPILPIVTVRNLDEAIAFVNSRDHPLTLYAFSNNPENKAKILSSTMSGGVNFNDTVAQLSLDDVPFGGVGESGYGRQVCRYGFEDFSYLRPVIDVPYEEEKFNGARYAPFTPEAEAFFAAGINVEIPR
ncbi:hypothetical protein CVT24_001299 [Panaeolus cyanescens]|uniref:Aldehyde dehydrogenase n=1 Tax=Panaeolus cyanescens TaxID=181874 RepID=A0A409YG15_9AGAR|nr:hypothetical protein CVT24_001299 [Panaeolus cyanescens]